MKIVIVSASVRTGRKSHRIALFLRSYITENNLGVAELLDLNDYQFPIFEERLSGMKSPPPEALQFAEKITSADGVIIVTPEYNGGYPASLKNVIDLLYGEWKRKPVALASASNGQFGGAQAITSLVFSLWKIGVCLVPAMYLGPNVQDAYTEDGVALNKTDTDRRAKVFIEELLWCMNNQRETAQTATADMKLQR